MIVVNMHKARAIHMRNLRAKRDAQLDELDREGMRHLTNSVKLAEIEARKQDLRDLPAKVSLQVEAASTPDQLKEIIGELNASHPHR